MLKRILQALPGTLIGLAVVLGASAPASGETTIQITDNSTDDIEPAISGSNVVWTGCDGRRTISRSTSGTAPPPPTSRTTPSMTGTPRSPARTSCGSGWTTATTRRSTSGTAPPSPSITEQQHRPTCIPRSPARTWCGRGGTMLRRLRDLPLETAPPPPRSRTTAPTTGIPPSPARTWCGTGTLGAATEIYLWDGATTTQITDNSTDDWHPAISGSNVVWHG